MKKFCSILFGAVLLVTNVSVAQDWPNLGRYQKANAEVMSNDHELNRVVFMGNSITEGWINLRPEFFEGKPYINRGISGQTTPQMLLRFRQDVIQLHPSIVVILAGINDIAGNTGPSTIEMIFDNIKSMAELAQANDIKIALCSVLPAAEFPWRPALEPAKKVVQLNSYLSKLADEHRDIVYVNYFAKMSDSRNGLKSELGSDGVHPNKKGYQLMEPILEAALQKLQE